MKTTFLALYDPNFEKFDSLEVAKKYVEDNGDPEVYTIYEVAATHEAEVKTKIKWKKS